MDPAQVEAASRPEHCAKLERRMRMAAATQSPEIADVDSSRNFISELAAALAHLDEFVREAWQYVEPDTPLRLELAP